MKRPLISFFIGLGLCLLLVSIWKTQFDQGQKLAAFERNPEGIMGTSCRLLVVVDFRDSDKAEKLLDKAEFQLRYVESLASNWIAESEISRFNAAGVGEFEFSETNWNIVQAAYQAFKDTNGAFDATCRPLIEAWKQAGQSGKIPSREALEEARVRSSWSYLELIPETRSVLKKKASVRLDLGGIAKGYAIDLALESVAELGVTGALVDVGGDIRVHGLANSAEGVWMVQVQDPQGEGVVDSFELTGGMAVCTSGNYARYVEIEGKRYSHILNPSTGYPTDSVPSVTVVADSTLKADVWATALSVLGQEGMKLLPAGVEAEMYFEDVFREGERVIRSSGFPVTIP